MKSPIFKVVLEREKRFGVDVSDISVYICLIDIRDGSSKPVYGGVDRLMIGTYSYAYLWYTMWFQTHRMHKKNSTFESGWFHYVIWSPELRNDAKLPEKHKYYTFATEILLITRACNDNQSSSHVEVFKLM